MTRTIEAGDPAPDFTMPAAGGRAARGSDTVRLADYAGKPLIIFFYPKDDTVACTREAVAFSAMQSRFARKGISLLGVSRDSPASHARFIAKHGLKVRLASDEDGTVCQAYGVWGQKKLYGRIYDGLIRTTFHIGADGLVSGVWRNVRVPGHAEAVFEAATAAN